MDYSQYNPPIVWDTETGVGSSSYGEVHARRHRDAEAAFMATHHQGKKRIVGVHCAGKKGHCLAWVELTPEPVIVYWVKAGSVSAELKRVRVELGNPGIDVEQKQYFDFLNAGDDLDLEAKCDCGGVRTLDRAKIQDAISKGKKRIVV